MQVEFIPSVCKDSEEAKASFSGSVKVQVPSFDERYQFIEDCGIDVADDGGVSRKGSNFSIIRNMVKASEKFYKGVEMKRLSDGKEFKSFADLSMDPDCDSILIEVAKEIRNGFRPSQK
jgi:hypothetical protein